MANGIKLRRGLQTTLAGTIAEGELVMATDTGKLGLKKGSTEHFVDLPTLVDAVSALQAQPVSEPGLIEVNYFRLFDFTNASEIDLFGKLLIPIAKLNPLIEVVTVETVQLLSTSLTYSILAEQQSGVAYSLESRPNLDYRYSLNSIVLNDYGYGIAANNNLSPSNGSSIDNLEVSFDSVTNLVYIHMPETTNGNTISILVDFKCKFKSITQKVNDQYIFVFLPPTTNEVIFQGLGG